MIGDWPSNICIECALGQIRCDNSTTTHWEQGRIHGYPSQVLVGRGVDIGSFGHLGKDSELKKLVHAEKVIVAKVLDGQ